MTNINAAWLIVNYACNNKCLWCYAGASGQNNMPYAQALKTIDLLKKIDVSRVILIGGEPTLYPTINGIIKYSKQNDLRVSIVTNGRKLAIKENLDKLIDAGIDGISISVEGSCKRVHDYITSVPGSYAQTMRGIKNCVATKAQISTTTTICNENISDLENILDLLVDYDVKDIGFNICTDSPNAVSPKNTISPNVAAKIIESLYARGKSKNVVVRSITPLPICNINKEIREDMLEKKILNKFCQMYAGSGLAIDPQGNILPCVHWADYSLGNLHKNHIRTKKQFTQFWTNPNKLPYKFRQALSKYPANCCKSDKKYWGKCIGGCPLFWFKYNPEQEIKGLEEVPEPKKRFSLF